MLEAAVHHPSVVAQHPARVVPRDQRLVGLGQVGAQRVAPEQALFEGA
jgi:hypothetical protein